MASGSVNEDIDSNSENGEDSPGETINVSECESKVKLHDDGDTEAPFLHSYEEMVKECETESSEVTIEKTCGICSEKRQAESFCTTCQDALCVVCTDEHKVIRSTRDHTIVDITELVKATNKMCGICSASSKNVEAVSYCEDCPEYLCSDCTEKHKVLKTTRTHAVLNLDMKCPDNYPCEVCTELGKDNVDASSYCQECDQNLCGICVEQHKRIKSTRNHSVIPISEKASNNKAKICRNEGSVIYKRQNRPSPDTRMKEDKHLTDNTTREKTYGSLDTMKMMPDGNSDFLCERCSDVGKSIQGISACKQCKEVLCHKCTTRHSSRKNLRHHKCIEIRKLFRQDVRCEPCLAQGNDVPALFQCKDCDEIFCKSCKNHHASHRMSRDHVVIPVLEYLLEIFEEEQQCDPCKYQGISSVAVGHCGDCKVPDPLCTTCIEQHKAQKMTRSHIIVFDNVSEFDKIKNLNEDQKDEAPQGMAKAEIKEEIERKQSETCSKPTVDEIKLDSVRLIWEHPENSKETVDQYQVRYRIKKDGNGEKWKFMFSEDKRNNTVISGLRSDTTYEFQVRPVYDDTEAPYSIVSDPVKTPPSLASKMLKSSTKISDSDPKNIAVYRLNSTELTDARNTTAKTRKVVLGEENKFITKETNLMLVGATGNGKSTLVDALVNYLMGVSFDDPFRFKLVSLEQGEDRQSNQALSQTEWVTSYIIHPDKDGRYDFKINIIDTPGFGDTRGIDRHTDIVRQIKVLFSDEAPKGVAFLDAVCFLVKAPDARLSVTQKYIFHSVMSLFGNDISQNICTLITFADGDNSPVESALKESELPFGEKFRFNNVGLFASNENLSSDSLLPKFWSMGHKSFKSLFEHIKNFETKSLTLTMEVLEQREFLQSTVDNLQPQVNEGLHKLNELRNEINILQGHKTDIESNKDFEYTVDEIQKKLIELEVGHYVTNCLTCNTICHKDCAFPDDDQKANCFVLDKTGHCKVCPGKCYWKQHKNTGYIIGFKTKKVTKTYKEKLQKFEEATGKILTHEKLIITMWEDLGKLFLQIEGMMADVNECRGELKEIALVPDILSMPEQTDLMIQTEKMDKIPGFDERIKMLSGMKKKAEIHKGVDEFRAYLKNIETEMKKQISDATLSDDGVQNLERWFSEWLDFS